MSRRVLRLWRGQHFAGKPWTVEKWIRAVGVVFVVAGLLAGCTDAGSTVPVVVSQTSGSLTSVIRVWPDEPIGEVFAYWTHNTVTGDLVIGYVQPEVRTLTSNAPQPLHLSEAVDDLGGGRVFVQFGADRDLGRLVLTVDDVEVIPDFHEDQ